MYFKCIKDGKIVDVFSDEDIVYVKWDAGLNMFLRTPIANEAVGVLSSDASVIYVFADRAGYDKVELKEFEDEAEYLDLKRQVEEAQTPEYIEPTEDPDPEEVDPGVLDNTPISAEEAFRIIFGGN